MKRIRRTFSAEYKLEAVKLVTEQGYSVAQACASLGLGETALRRWIKQFEAEQSGVVLQGTVPLTPEQKQIRALQEKVKRLELEKKILKKATAILASGELQNIDS